ncbi:MAG TPA: hypothetical protein VH480_01885 [Streptosporangiaceae bacterium]
MSMNILVELVPAGLVLAAGLRELRPITRAIAIRLLEKKYPAAPVDQISSALDPKPAAYCCARQGKRRAACQARSARPEACAIEELQTAMTPPSDR